MYERKILCLISSILFILSFSIEISIASFSEPIYYKLPLLEYFPSNIYAFNDEKIWMIIPRISKIGCLNPKLSSISLYDLPKDSIPSDITIVGENMFLIFSGKTFLTLFSLNSFNFSFYELNYEPIDLASYKDGVWITLPDINEIIFFSLSSKEISKRIKCSTLSTKNVLTISSNYLWAILDTRYQIARISLNSYETKILNLSSNVLLLSSSINDEIWIFNEKNEILKIDQNGKIIYKKFLGEGAILINELASSQDGSLWYIDIGRKRIGHITNDGIKEEMLVKDISIRAFSLSPNNKLWFIDEKNNQIGFVEYTKESINETTSIITTEQTTFTSVTNTPISPMIFTELLFGILLIFPIVILLIKKISKKRRR
ncbi:MAG: hypothetical protein QXP60_05260 [Nitrososphaerota archaeon]